MLERLIIFARYPQPGQVKTRLIPALGAAGAANLYRQMAEATLAQARELQGQRSPLQLEVRFVGGTFALMRDWLGQELLYTNQGDGDLGARMARSLNSAFAAGMQRAVIIGTDCPDLDAELMEQAFQNLVQHDVVLGPAKDGGYYLIGLRQPIPELFAGIAWSTSVVLQQTVTIAQQLGFAIAYLPILSDIDHPEDLHHFQLIKPSTR
jgi:hypothetical protein